MTSKEIKEIIETWQNRTIDELREFIDRTEKSIIRQQEEIKELLSEMQQLDVNNKYYIDKMQRMNSDIKSTLSYLKDDKALYELGKPILEEKEKELKALEESKEPKFEVLKKFMEQWKDDAINYYLNLFENGYTGNDSYILNMLDHGKSYIEKVFEKEAKTRLANMIMMIKEKTGEVIECDLFNNSNNKYFGFEGWVTGVKRSVKIQAVIAGGWNVQKLHVRLLID